MGTPGWHGLRAGTAGLGAGHEPWDGGCQRAHQKLRPQAKLQREAKDQQKSQGLWKRLDASGCDTGGKKRHLNFEQENCLLQYVQKIKEFELFFFKLTDCKKSIPDFIMNFQS